MGLVRTRLSSEERALRRRERYDVLSEASNEEDFTRRMAKVMEQRQKREWFARQPFINPGGGGRGGGLKKLIEPQPGLIDVHLYENMTFQLSPAATKYPYEIICRYGPKKVLALRTVTICGIRSDVENFTYWIQVEDNRFEYKRSGKKCERYKKSYTLDWYFVTRIRRVPKRWRARN